MSGIAPVGGSRAKSGFEKLNGAGTPVSEKVHLDEIAVTPDSDVLRPRGLMTLAVAGRIACRAGMAPI
jgi:hypothetical protein